MWELLFFDAEYCSKKVSPCWSYNAHAQTTMAHAMYVMYMTHAMDVNRDVK